jgi:hypothetical protein
MVEGSNSNAQIIVVKIATYGELGSYSSNFNGNNVGSSALYFNINEDRVLTFRMVEKEA